MVYLKGSLEHPAVHVEIAEYGDGYAFVLSLLVRLLKGAQDQDPVIIHPLEYGLFLKLEKRPHFAFLDIVKHKFVVVSVLRHVRLRAHEGKGALRAVQLH